MEWDINHFIKDLQDAESEGKDPLLIKPRKFTRTTGAKVTQEHNLREWVSGRVEGGCRGAEG